MNYTDAIDWIFEKLPMYQRLGVPAYKADLNNTINLLDIVGNPHKNLKFIHIAGTNGKGSVSNMLASIMQETGLKVGLYTSPHLFDYRERIRINGQKISENFVVNFIENYRNQIEEINPSFFEISVVMAFLWFKQENIDIGVIEVGMGGRLDSTNVIKPILSIITNIGLDHTFFLGDTKEKIAIEKAGIIKNNIPVIVGETDIETINIFKKVAKEKDSKILIADKNLFFIQLNDNCQINSKYLYGNIAYKGKVFMKEISCPLSGEYQKKNILTVIRTCIKLKKLGYKISKKNIKNGIKNIKQNTGFFGRWEILSTKPLVICDVAHNNEGFKIVFKQLLSFDYNKLHIVFGVNNDKNLSKLFDIIPQNAKYYFCKANIPRALDTEKLCEFAKSKNIDFEAFKSVSDAYYTALKQAKDNDIIFIGGSTFIVAEIPQTQIRL